MGKDYLLRPEEECRACGIPGDRVPLGSFNPETGGGIEIELDKPFFICQLCAETRAGNTVQWPSNYLESPSARDIYRHVNRVINIAVRQIIEALKEPE